MRSNDFRVLRYKGPDASSDIDVDVDDPDWHAEQENPNSGRYVVAGTATAGDYILTATTVDGKETASVTFTRVAEAHAAIAAGLAAAVIAAVAADPRAEALGRFFRSATNPTGANLHVVYQQHPKDFVVTLTAPGSATLDMISVASSTGDRFPIARSIASDLRVPGIPTEQVEVTVIALDTSNVPIAPGSCTYSMEFLEVIPRKSDTNQELPDAVASRGRDVSIPLGEINTVQCNGAALFGCRMYAIANEPSGTDRFEIRYRQVVV